MSCSASVDFLRRTNVHTLRIAGENGCRTAVKHLSIIRETVVESHENGAKTRGARAPSLTASSLMTIARHPSAGKGNRRPLTVSCAHTVLPMPLPHACIVVRTAENGT